jgi:hypothetical protein
MSIFNIIGEITHYSQTPLNDLAFKSFEFEHMKHEARLNLQLNLTPVFQEIIYTPYSICVTICSFFITSDAKCNTLKFLFCQLHVTSTIPGVRGYRVVRCVCTRTVHKAYTNTFKRFGFQIFRIWAYEGCSRNASCALNLISTFFITNFIMINGTIIFPHILNKIIRWYLFNTSSLSRENMHIC